MLLFLSFLGKLSAASQHMNSELTKASLGVGKLDISVYDAT